LSWLIAISLFAVTFGDVTVRSIGGTAVRGGISVWDQSGIALATDDDSTQRIPREELLEIDFGATEASSVPPGLELLLVDGSTIPAADCEIKGRQVQMNGHGGGLSEEFDWTLSFEQLRAVRFDRTTPNQDEAWKQITQRTLTSDLLVVYKKSRGTLDEIEGVIQQVTPAIVLLQVDGEPIEVPRERVFGLVFYRRNGEQLPQASIRVQGSHGLELFARDVRFESGRLAVDLLGGDTLKVPLQSIGKLSFPTGAIFYLSDIEPIKDTSHWQPLYKLPEKAPLLALWGQPRRNESIGGGKLRLEQQKEAGQPNFREFDRGLAMRSRSEASFRLPEGYNSFQAIVGIDPASHSDTEALLIIEADGQTMGEWHLQRKADPQVIDFGINGKRQLRLIVDYGSGTDAGDVVHICDPRLVK